MPPDLKSQLTPAIAAVIGKLKLLVLDVDGVLTDGRLWYNSAGEEMKVFDVKDGHGLVRLRHKANFQMAIISGRTHPATALRAKELGIEHVFQRCHDKKRELRELREKLGLAPQQCCAIGDDTPDISMFSEVGLSVAVADALEPVKQVADLITSQPGGRGAVRELCEFILDHSENDDAN